MTDAMTVKTATVQTNHVTEYTTTTTTKLGSEAKLYKLVMWVAKAMCRQWNFQALAKLMCHAKSYAVFTKPAQALSVAQFSQN